MELGHLGADPGDGDLDLRAERAHRAPPRAPANALRPWAGTCATSVISTRDSFVDLDGTGSCDVM
jgi:hypothetical protein